MAADVRSGGDPRRTKVEIIRSLKGNSVRQIYLLIRDARPSRQVYPDSALPKKSRRDVAQRAESHRDFQRSEDCGYYSGGPTEPPSSSTAEPWMLPNAPAMKSWIGQKIEPNIFNLQTLGSNLT